MPEQPEEERQLAELIVESLILEDASASDIRPKAPLFGGGLDLDSIDAPKLALAITKRSPHASLIVGALIGGEMIFRRHYKKRTGVWNP